MSEAPGQPGHVDEQSTPEAEDDRPPICPACGVTMGIVVDQRRATSYVCLECGFSDETTDDPAIHSAQPQG